MSSRFNLMYSKPCYLHGFFYRLSIVVLALIPFISSCQDYGKLKLISTLPETLEEVSGIEYDNISGKLLCITDSGNKSELYEYEVGGKITKVLDPKGADNEDWEDIAADQNFFYIADTGNNNGNRKKMEIYIVDRSDIKPDDDSQNVNTEKLDFDILNLPDFDDEYPDIEAIYVKGTFIYMIARDRKDIMNGKAQIFRIDRRNDGGKATLLGMVATCSDHKYCQITGADISPDGNQLALLTADKVMLYELSRDGIPSGTPIIIDLGHYSQKESICYKNNKELYIADEQRGSTGGNLYLLRLKD